VDSRIGTAALSLSLSLSSIREKDVVFCMLQTIDRLYAYYTVGLISPSNPLSLSLSLSNLVKKVHSFFDIP